MSGYRRETDSPHHGGQAVARAAKTPHSMSPKPSPTTPLDDVRLNLARFVSKTCPVAAATRTRPTSAGRLWRGRQRFHTRRSQSRRRLRRFVRLSDNLLGRFASTCGSTVVRNILLFVERLYKFRLCLPRNVGLTSPEITQNAASPLAFSAKSSASRQISV